MLSDMHIELTKEQIERYFSELAKEYRKLGGKKLPIEIVIIGGAAIITNYGFRNSTTDIDAIIPVIGIIKEAIRNVGDKNNLPIDWLNTDFIHTDSFSTKLVNYSKHYKTYNGILTIRTISGEYLIAMKLKSGRLYKNDISDIIGILNEHKKQGNEITISNIDIAIKDLYGGWAGIKQEIIEIINTILAIGEYEKLYDEIRIGEKNTGEVIKEFNIKYPNKLNKDSIDSIINSLDHKMVIKESVRSKIQRLKNEKLNRSNQSIEKKNEDIQL